jgi:hypothetical protein
LLKKSPKISNAWHLKRDFDIQRDFPLISTWVTKISPASLKMCFNHDLSKKNNSYNEQNEYSNENAGRGNYLDFSKLKADFPDTEHKVFIVETLKIMRINLHEYLFNSNPAYKKTPMHKNNELSINYIIYMMCDEGSYNSSLVILLLSALPSKPNDFKLQIREVNLVIAHMRMRVPALKKTLQYILIGDDDFDNYYFLIIIEKCYKKCIL